MLHSRGVCRNRYDDGGNVAKENVAGIFHITHITILHIYYLVTHKNSSEENLGSPDTSQAYTQ